MVKECPRLPGVDTGGRGTQQAVNSWCHLAGMQCRHAYNITAWSQFGGKDETFCQEEQRRTQRRVIDRVAKETRK